jgi:hypothetical protein
MLDEQSFQDMLAAAYTIQEHNTKRRQSLRAASKCAKCGAGVQEGKSLCEACSADEVRPGEKLQQKWASMWLMSQEAGISPGPSLEQAPQLSNDHVVEQRDSVLDDSDLPLLEPPRTLVLQEPEPDLAPENSLPTVLHSPLADGPLSVEHSEIESPAVRDSGSLAELQLKLRFHRADLYLVVAILISTFAMLWVLLATPATGAQRKPRLRPWERAMISLGLADAPETPPKRGNPNSQVWVDPKTALYYCSGDERYGKTPGGHETTQREAQLDSFEPATRAVCE